MAISAILITVITHISLVVSASDNDFEHATWMDDNNNYKLHWKIDEAEKSIRFAAEVKTTSWIGFGISKDLSGKMSNADLVVGWIDSAGKCFLKVYDSVYFMFSSVTSLKGLQSFEQMSGRHLTFQLYYLEIKQIFSLK